MNDDASAKGMASPVTLAGAGGLGLGIGVAVFMLVGPGSRANVPAQPAPMHQVVESQAAPTAAPKPVPVIAHEPGAAAEPAPETDKIGDPVAAEPAHADTDDKPDPARAAQVDALVTRLAAAYQTLRAPADASSTEKAIESSLDDVFGKDKLDKRFAKELYAAYGPGRFVRNGHLTSLGQAVLARAHELDAHAIDAAPYALDQLDQALANVAKTGGDAAASGGPALAIMVGALQSLTFDAAGVKERLLAIPDALDDGMVGSALVQAQASSASGPSAADMPNDARLMRTFIDLVFDFRFIKKAGPFLLRERGSIYERQKKDLNAFVAQLFGAADGAGAMDLLIPPHPQYRRMVEVYALYKGYAAAGCEKLPGAWRFRKGSKGKEVEKLQHRLACEGYYEGAFDGVYDGPTTEAVKAFQRHHDLDESGDVLDETMDSINISMDYRVRQIALVLQRMREGRFDRMGDFFLRVNLPAFLLRAYENGKVVKEHRVIIGTNKLDDDKVELTQGHINRTKIFGTRLYQVIVNPTWILPKRVEAGELATNIEKDPDHLAKSNIKKVKLGSGTEVFVQGAGKGNVLGKVKFLLEESNAIYLHDTDKRQLFKKRERAFSHGCMRVHEAVEFGQWLLARDGWDPKEVDRSIGSSSQRGFDMHKPVNLVTEYMTVDLADDGFPIFFTDIYGYDSAFWADKLPPTERVRWGSAVLRPRWVPVMDGETVEGWHKAGKAAPRDLGPDGKPLKKAPKPEEGAGEP